MGSKAEKDRQKQIQDRCQNLLSQMLRDDDNKYCVDCDAKGPRWASWNLGIFLCIRCAGIHRNLGVHISKVKSVNLDTWTPEQVVSLQQMGNSRARAVYEANLPDSFRRPQTDSALEAFIRAKYEAKKYIAKEWVSPPTPKVNWDKELDEEDRARKKKRESRSAIIPAPTPRKMDSVIPQPLPKPTTSPKTQRSTPPTRHKPPVAFVPPPAPSHSTDLLGLDTPVSESAPPCPVSEDDSFANFLSASSGNAGVRGRSEEEESFFNQAAGGGVRPPPGASGGDKRLTTDSILALYSKNPPANAFQTPPPQQGMTFLGQQQPGFQPYLPNGSLGQTVPVNVFQNSAGVGLVSNPFYSMGMPQGNPQNRLSQQMAGLNLTPKVPTNPGQTGQSQIWP